MTDSEWLVQQFIMYKARMSKLSGLNNKSAASRLLKRLSWTQYMGEMHLYILAVHVYSMKKTVHQFVSKF